MKILEIFTGNMQLKANSHSLTQKHMAQATCLLKRFTNAIESFACKTSQRYPSTDSRRSVASPTHHSGLQGMRNLFLLAFVLTPTQAQNVESVEILKLVEILKSNGIFTAPIWKDRLETTKQISGYISTYPYYQYDDSPYNLPDDINSKIFRVQFIYDKSVRELTGVRFTDFGIPNQKANLKQAIATIMGCTPEDRAFLLEFLRNPCPPGLPPPPPPSPPSSPRPGEPPGLPPRLPPGLPPPEESQPLETILDINDDTTCFYPIYDMNKSSFIE